MYRGEVRLEVGKWHYRVYAEESCGNRNESGWREVKVSTVQDWFIAGIGAVVLLAVAGGVALWLKRERNKN